MLHRPGMTLLLFDDEMFERAWSELVDFLVQRIEYTLPPSSRTGAPP